MNNAKLDAALELAGQGFRIFPIIPNTKRPAVKDNLQKATADAGQIRRWWKTEPTYNIGVATGGDVFVVDADVKDDRGGLNSLDFLTMLFDLPDSLTVDTPSGGRHLYLRKPVDLVLTSNAGKVEGFGGLDIRAEGGFVVGPGSTIDGKAYAAANSNPVLQAPDCVFDLLRRPVAKRIDARSVEADLPHHLERATHWLANQAPEAVMGAGGDETTFSVAAELRALGVSEPAALDLMLEHWNETKALPPWTPDELAVKVENAFRYGQGAPGGKTAAGEFDVLEIDVGAPPPTLAERVMSLKKPFRRQNNFRLFSLADSISMLHEATAEPLIDGLLDQGTLALIYGRPGCGKSFVALDMGGCVATGRPWNGRETTAGLVVYIAAEGGAGIHRRTAALAFAKGIDPSAPFRLLPQSVDLFSSDADLEKIAREVDALAGSAGPPRMIVVDTLARVLTGDENSGKDMGQLLRNLDRLREQTEATVLVIHHTGKDTSKGSRGHSSLLGAVDTEIEIADRTIRTTKQRDHAPMSPEIRFQLVPVDLGRDGRGRPLNSLAVTYLDADDFETILMPLDGAAERFRQSLVSAHSANGGRPVPWKTWADTHCRSIDPGWASGTTPPTGCSAGNLRKLRAEVVDSGHARSTGLDCFEPVSGGAF